MAQITITAIPAERDGRFITEHIQPNTAPLYRSTFTATKLTEIMDGLDDARTALLDGELLPRAQASHECEKGAVISVIVKGRSPNGFRKWEEETGTLFVGQPILPAEQTEVA